MDVDYVGNPILDAIASNPQDDLFRIKHNLDLRPIVALLPGSRKQELERVLPEMVKTSDRFPEFQFEMVRLGIGLYGVSANGNHQIKSISRLKTCISQIRSVPYGETVGYGRKGVVTKDAQVAVLPIGYADGYDRRLSNGVGKVFVNGEIVPVIGNICMDMCMIVVTGFEVAVGDEVELMGENIRVNELASSIGTISYEILTGISQRVKRIYLQE